MSKLTVTKKILSFITCLSLSAGIIAAYPALTEKNEKASARTLQEVQEEREANQQKINELQAKLDALGNDKANEEAYQETLAKQIDLIRSNINSLNAELETINADIDATKENIASLDQSITDQQTAIDNKVADFKERLYSMYVSGDENIAAVFLGSVSFYDILSNVEKVNRIAAYDEDLINHLLEDIDNLQQSKEDLQTEKLTLEMKLQSQEVKKAEKEEELSSYDEKMSQTKDVIERIKREEDLVSGDKAELEAYLASLDAESNMITEKIKREQEEAQRRYEEEQRRIAQEKAEKAAAEKAAAEKAAAEKAAAEKAAADAEKASNEDNNNNNNNAQEETINTEPEEPVTYDIPAPSASGFLWPAPGFCYISSYYGERWGRLHAGIDIGDGGIGGGAAVASKSGTVIMVDNTCDHNYPKSSSCCGSGYGNYVVISHDGTYSTLYGHLAYATVSPGDYVEAGQQIGVIGCTGFSTGDHLHFEVRVNGSAQDPLTYVSP